LALLGDEFVTALRAREVDGVVRKPVNPFSVGQQISVRGGPLDGMVGEILELRDKDRVFVLLSLLNSEVKAQFRCDQIAAAGV
jgi:transcriptional antiterminator RfaH